MGFVHLAPRMFTTLLPRIIISAPHPRLHIIFSGLLSLFFCILILFYFIYLYLYVSGRLVCEQAGELFAARVRLELPRERSDLEDRLPRLRLPDPPRHLFPYIKSNQIYIIK